MGAPERAHPPSGHPIVVARQHPTFNTFNAVSVKKPGLKALGEPLNLTGITGNNRE